MFITFWEGNIFVYKYKIGPLTSKLRESPIIIWYDYLLKLIHGMRNYLDNNYGNYTTDNEKEEKHDAFIRGNLKKLGARLINQKRWTNTSTS